MSSIVLPFAGCLLSHVKTLPKHLKNMPPKAKTTGTTRTESGIDARELETLIREAVRSEMNLQQSRNRSASSYIQRLQETDEKVTKLIQEAINETTRAYRLSVNFLFVGYVAASLILLGGLLFAVPNIDNPEMFAISLLFVAVGIIWIINLQNRNLSKNNRALVNNLAKLNIIFAGYTRQIHQVDAVFEEIVKSNAAITPEIAEKLLNNLQDAMTEAMGAVTSISAELEE